MNKNHLFLLAALALILAGAGCNKSGKLSEPSKFKTPTGPVELKLKWKPGERVVLNMDVKSKSETAIPGQPVPMKQDTTMGQKYALTVLQENPGGGHEVEMEFLSARMSSAMAGKNQMDFDSTQPATADSTNPVAGMFNKIVGSKIRYFLDASNNVERIEGVDDMIKRMSEGGKPNALAPLKSMFSEGYLKQMMSNSRFMPPNAVAPGDTWPVQLELPMDPLGTLRLDYTFTLQGWEMHGARNCARMEFQGTIKTKPGAKTNPSLMGMTMTIKDGTTTGVSWFDPELGITIDSTMNQDITIGMTIPKNPKVKTGPYSQPQNIAIQMNQILNIKLDSVK